MGCGWTYKGAARYRLGPAYLHQQSEQLRASAVHNNPGPSVIKNFDYTKTMK
jgi:hypothetical protein